MQLLDLRVQAEYLAWAKKGLSQGRFVAATVTFKPSLARGVPLSSQGASATVNLYRKRLNRMAYGNHSRPERGNAQLRFFAASEGGTADVPTLHYHLVIEVPPEKDMAEWLEACRRCWLSLQWASSGQNRFEEMYSDGWIEYLLKLRSKKNLSDSVDLNTVVLNS